MAEDLDDHWRIFNGGDDLQSTDEAKLRATLTTYQESLPPWERPANSLARQKR